MATKKKAVNSNRKGKAGERKAAEYLRSLGFTDARRTQQYNGEGKSDVICPESLPGLHIEVKYGYPRTSFDLGSRVFEDAINQAARDAGKDWWIVLWRPKNCHVWRLSFAHDLNAERITTIYGDKAIQDYLDFYRVFLGDGGEQE